MAEVGAIIGGFFRRNIGLKLTALVTSLVLFSAVRGAEDAQRSVFVNVAATLPPADADRMLVSQPPDQVRLTLRGPRSQINAIDELEAVVIDLTDTDQRYYYFADDDFDDIPAGVSITQVAPTSIPLEWARRIVRNVPVQPRLTGQPGEGLVLGEPARVTPSSVELVGPVTEIESMRSIRTEPVDLGELEEGRQQLRIPLARQPPHTRINGDAFVTVSLNVVLDRLERTVGDIAVTAPEGITVEPQRVAVTVEGSPDELELLTAEGLQASVDTADVQEDGRLEVRLEGVPADLELVRIEPS
ncbi:MAG: CdaR family protein, partial [Myxococcota bacterium]